MGEEIQAGKVHHRSIDISGGDDLQYGARERVHAQKSTTDPINETYSIITTNA
jgi:hypothetical protein